MKRFVVILLTLIIIVCPFNTQAVSVSAKAAVLLNAENGEVIYAKNCDERLSMASTTKIMTALLLCEYGHFEREITVTAEMLRVEGSSMGLLAGDKVTLHDLLYGLMLASGNDAANVIAFAVGGSVAGFVEKMNQKARELELANTHFETPSGLDGDNHYTTAYELALLTRYALQNEELCKAVSTQKANLNYGNPPYKRSLTNHNRLLKQYEGAVGVKTGFTKKSGRCLVSAAKRDGKFLIAVTLNAPNDWQDHKAMLDYGFSQIKQTYFMPQYDSYNIPVIGGAVESVTVKIKPYTVNSLDTANITCDIFLPSFVYAPTKKGETVGKAVYKQGDKILSTEPLFAENEVLAVEGRESVLSAVFKNFKYILKCI